VARRWCWARRPVFDELRRPAAAQTGLPYAFDLIEHDGEDLHDRPFLDRKAELARLLRDTKAGMTRRKGESPACFASRSNPSFEASQSSSRYRSMTCNASVSGAINLPNGEVRTDMSLGGAVRANPSGGR
jgi:hypothetical protein